MNILFLIIPLMIISTPALATTWTEEGGGTSASGSMSFTGNITISSNCTVTGLLTVSSSIFSNSMNVSSIIYPDGSVQVSSPLAGGSSGGIKWEEQLNPKIAVIPRTSPAYTYNKEYAVGMDSVPVVVVCFPSGGNGALKSTATWDFSVSPQYASGDCTLCFNWISSNTAGVAVFKITVNTLALNASIVAHTRTIIAYTQTVNDTTLCKSSACITISAGTINKDDDVIIEISSGGNGATLTSDVEIIGAYIREN